ncbi:hypothetical protein RF679_00550 [Undibacterium cyanobacteriorum]|uniref:Uncharacterized protein n=1 Tax=Undibacterium cyanobacteriorum TaxID=3073561 RepID=A0ABY9RJC9_9BURK|nr:hypothetical protein [Undibacterium sp. 20NA77.5]WMW80784.1 hypothetical protein RF679_00550 [Undibacterium sp. 20NA77.5]
MLFEDLPLHDASLLEVRVDWNICQCAFRVLPASQISHDLIFDKFKHIELPRHESWGPSISILETRIAAPQIFEIVLQSGDVLRIEAMNWSFVQTPNS